jgi:hypothetical protein
VERDIVISGDNNLGLSESGKEVTGFRKFVVFGSLGKVAGDGEQMRLDIENGLTQGFDGRFVDASEVKIGDVNDDSHEIRER